MILEDIMDFLKKTPPFQFLDEATLKSVAGSLSMEFYPKGTVVLKQNGVRSETLRIIKKGSIKVLMKSEDGTEVVVDYRGEGDSFGFLSMIGKDRQKTTVIAVDDTICYTLNKANVMKLFEASAAFAEYFMSYLSRFVDKTYREMQDKSYFYGSSDRFLFTTQVGDIASEVVTVSEDLTIQEAASAMVNNQISSLIVLDKRGLPAGIVTDRDLRDKVVAKGRNISEPVKNIMTISLIRVDARDSCFDAALKMIKYKIHHMLVIDDGALSGVMTNHDLMMLQGTSPLSLVKDIENQRAVEGLLSVSAKTNNIVGLLLKEGAKTGNIMKIITEINDRLVRKVIEISEKEYGQPPVPYCWIVFGSEGRKEQTFKTDQDNAIIYADPPVEQEQEVEKYFSGLATVVKDNLIKIGFPECPAGYMASNPAWSRPLKTWRRYFSDWFNEPTPDAVLKSLIFFDFRPVYGKFGLAEGLRDSFMATLKGHEGFLGHMANLIIRNTPPVGFLNSFVVEKSGEHKDELDLKVKGLGPLVDAVRFFALERDIKETSTLGRISAAKSRHAIVKEYASELEHAFDFIMLLRIHHQFEQITTGIGPDNFINPNKLSNLEKKTLKEVFHLISKLQGLILERYKQFIR